MAAARCALGYAGITEAQFSDEYTRGVTPTARFLRRKAWPVLSRDDAMDMAQTAWLRAWQFRSQFRGDCQFRSWVLKIALNVLLDDARKAHSEKRPTLVFADPLPEASVHSDFDQARKVEDVMATIPRQCRALVRLRYFEDLALHEIAERQGRPIGTIKSELFRALAPARAAARR